MPSPLKTLILLAVCAGAVPAAAGDSSLPVVDLGYERHRAALLTDYGFYNFSNIRFAQPPVGNLRFREPVPPQGRSSHIDDGSVGRVCPQVSPYWLEITTNATVAALLNQTFDVTAALAAAKKLPVVEDPRTTEDCLFLDVLAPKALLERSQSQAVAADGVSGAPVLIWLYPGGYLEGDKSMPDGYSTALLNTSQSISRDGVVFVTVNYRLGAFGWLSGPEVEADGTANAGLYDQRLAFQWVQDNIHLFGGDKNKVTVMGYSAGSGSILHQVTAFGGANGPPLFQQVVMDSAGFIPNPTNATQKRAYNDYLKLLNVTCLEEARKLPSSALIKANYQQSVVLPYGSLTYGPAVDGKIVPDLPGKLLLQGSYYKDIKVMTGRTSNEGILFTDPRINSTADFNEHLESAILGITPKALEYADTVLYPAVLDGSKGYHSQFERTAEALSEAVLACNSYYLDKAFGNNAYGYQTGIFPSFHVSDMVYLLYNGDPSSVEYPETAQALDEYVISFVISGKPSAKGFPAFADYGSSNQIMTLNGTAAGMIRDPMANPRCDWWQQGLFY